jgi:predicted RNA-binding protein YlxR (DUF448 family)/ribosomal protein L30E
MWRAVMTKPRPELDPALTGSAGPDLSDTAEAPYEEGGRGKLRQCCVTRERLPADAMIRFVLSPEGVVTPDINAKLPGRGVWVTGTAVMVETARAKGHFPRAFKSKAIVPASLAAGTEALLKARCLALIGFARKAGEAVSGHDQVIDALNARHIGLLLQAADGAREGRDKMLNRAHALHKSVCVIDGFSAADLGAAFGRDHTVHALIRRGAMADAIKAVYERLVRFRSTDTLSAPAMSSPESDNQKSQMGEPPESML